MATMTSAPSADDDSAGGDDDDAADLAAARAGDASAFSRLIRRHQSRLYAILARRCRTRQDAEDAMQNACLLAWRKLDQFRGEARFSTWLTRIAITQAASLGRRVEVRSPPASLTRPDGTMAPLEDPQPTPDAVADVREQTERRERLVRDAIGRLAEDHRDVVILKEFDGRSYLEIAEIIDVPVGTVRSRLHRARRELCELLGPLMEELDASDPAPIAAVRPTHPHPSPDAGVAAVARD